VKRGIILLVVDLFLLLIIIIPFQTYAATYYVSTSGDDTNSGIESEPWQSLYKTSTSINDGDTVLLKQGDTWLITENKRTEFKVGCGLWINNDNITISSYGDDITDKPVIDASGMSDPQLLRSTQSFAPIEVGTVYNIEPTNAIIKNLNLIGPFLGSTLQAYSIGDGFTVKNCDFTGDGWLDNDVSDAEALMIIGNDDDDILIEDCIFNTYDTDDYYSKAIEIRGGQGHVIRGNIFNGYTGGGALRFSNYVTGGLIENNYFYNPDFRRESNQAWALVIRSCDGGTFVVRNNVFDLIGGSDEDGVAGDDVRGIASWFDYQATTRKIYNNVFISDGVGAGVKAQGSSTSTLEIFNNIFYNLDYGFDSSGGEGDYTHFKNNIFWNVDTQRDTDIATEVGSIEVNPLFVNPSMGNHEPYDVMIELGSPAINAGINTDQNIPELDFNSDPRDNNPDIGVFEYVGEQQTDPAKECEDWKTLHPEWILCEDWETGVIDTDKWNDGQTSGINHLVTTEKFAGNYALEMIHEDSTSGGYLNSIWYHTGYNKYLDHGFDHVYARWYSKLSDEFDGTGSKLGGFSIKRTDMTGFWNGHTGAGIRPDGYTNGGGFRIVTGNDVGPNDVGEARFYAYHTEQILDRWENNGQLYYKYYGDATAAPDSYQDTPGDTTGAGNYYCSWDTWSEFSQVMGEKTYSEYLDDDRHLEKDTWYCIEAELKINSPGENDAEIRYWINDIPKGEWIGLKFREHADMEINLFQLTGSSGTGHGLQHSYFDNVVVSTQRIGCVGTIPEPSPELEQCTVADSNRDNEITNKEIDDYITLWIEGGVSIADLFDVIEKWKVGC
jgi:hypothetical protein